LPGGEAVPWLLLFPSFISTSLIELLLDLLNMQPSSTPLAISELSKYICIMKNSPALLHCWGSKTIHPGSGFSVSTGIVSNICKKEKKNTGT
jgi:hypothetical protein